MRSSFASIATGLSPVRASSTARWRNSAGCGARRRQQQAGPATRVRSWTAQQRLCGRYRRLAARKTSRNVVTVAIARELAGFLWAEMTTTD
jgi:hypothetical protein